MSGHQFWSMGSGIDEATASFVERLFGPLQLRDAYLRGLAIANDGILVTGDRAIPQIAGSVLAKHDLLLV